MFGLPYISSSSYSSMSVLLVFSAPCINRLDVFLLDFDCITSEKEGLLLFLSSSHVGWCSCLCASGNDGQEGGGSRCGRYPWGSAPGGSRTRLGEDVNLLILFLFPVKEAKLYLSMRGRSSCCFKWEGESEVGSDLTRMQESPPAGGHSPGLQCLGRAHATLHLPRSTWKYPALPTGSLLGPWLCWEFWVNSWGYWTRELLVHIKSHPPKGCMFRETWL